MPRQEQGIGKRKRPFHLEEVQYIWYLLYLGIKSKDEWGMNDRVGYFGLLLEHNYVNLSLLNTRGFLIRHRFYIRIFRCLLKCRCYQKLDRIELLQN